jgi:hypothetical protein
MDTSTKQEYETLKVALLNFIHAAEVDSVITDEVYFKLKTLTDNYQQLTDLNLGITQA